ncbi:MAG: MerR family transcriptional regulator [Anaerolineales bacterium]|nr:MerR family transcriptional regulator [Anaerolineales bacterium]
MTTLSKVPAYNLKVVVRETGIKPDTLRAWERRYGMPSPERTPGGHRLYSEYDIESLKWLRRRQEEGLRINRAVQLWRNIEEEGQNPLEAEEFDRGTRTTPIEVLAGSTLMEIREQWVDACMTFDESSAEQILAQAFARYPLETVCLEVLGKGIAEVGDQWYRGEATVQQEHFTSALTERRLDALLAAAPAPSRNRRILVACPAGENHVLSPLMLALFLRHRGWDVIYLGANVPLEHLDATMRTTEPDLVLLIAFQLHTAANLVSAAQYLESMNVVTTYGGPVFNILPELHNRIPAHYLGGSIDQAIVSVEQLLKSPIPNPTVEDIPDTLAVALAHFRAQRPHIEASIWENLRLNETLMEYLEIANQNLMDDIEAALILGDMEFLKPDVAWIKDLLILRGLAPEMLSEYIALVQQVLSENLDSRGQPILDWIDGLLENDF